jgi:hypothetical protein
LLRHKQVLRLRELESMLGDDLREAAVFGGTVAGDSRNGSAANICAARSGSPPRAMPTSSTMAPADSPS